jgi:hypothetical protein
MLEDCYDVRRDDPGGGPKGAVVLDIEGLLEWFLNSDPDFL